MVNCLESLLHRLMLNLSKFEKVLLAICAQHFEMTQRTLMDLLCFLLDHSLRVRVLFWIEHSLAERRWSCFIQLIEFFFDNDRVVSLLVIIVCQCLRLLLLLTEALKVFNW